MYIVLRNSKQFFFETIQVDRRVNKQLFFKILWTQIFAFSQPCLQFRSMFHINLNWERF